MDRTPARATYSATLHATTSCTRRHGDVGQLHNPRTLTDDGRQREQVWTYLPTAFQKETKRWVTVGPPLQAAYFVNQTHIQNSWEGTRGTLPCEFAPILELDMSPPLPRGSSTAVPPRENTQNTAVKKKNVFRQHIFTPRTDETCAALQAFALLPQQRPEQANCPQPRHAEREEAQRDRPTPSRNIKPESTTPTTTTQVHTNEHRRNNTPKPYHSPHHPCPP